MASTPLFPHNREGYDMAELGGSDTVCASPSSLVRDCAAAQKSMLPLRYTMPS